jgi:hypothetical protein
MTAVFEDNFDRPNTPLQPALLTMEGGAAADGQTLLGDAALVTAAVREGGAHAEAGVTVTQLLGEAGPSGPFTSALPPNPLGPDWTPAQTDAWRIENGRLCGQMAHNHGVWLNRVLRVNARVEFDGIAMTDEGDLKTEVWGDGQSAARSRSYVDATSYLAILGGWHNRYHVLARINEHGTDRKEIKVDPTGRQDDPTTKPVVRGQVYHFKVERTDGHTVKWSVDGLDYASWNDPNPLAGAGHDHFGFNEWEVKTCYDNVRVTPL